MSANNTSNEMHNNIAYILSRIIANHTFNIFANNIISEIANKQYS